MYWVNNKTNKMKFKKSLGQNLLIDKNILKKILSLTSFKNKNIIGLSKNELKMLSTNFCYGGEEIYEIENF